MHLSSARKSSSGRMRHKRRLLSRLKEAQRKRRQREKEEEEGRSNEERERGRKRKREEEKEKRSRKEEKQYDDDFSSLQEHDNGDEAHISNEKRYSRYHDGNKGVPRSSHKPSKFSLSLASKKRRHSTPSMSSSSTIKFKSVHKAAENKLTQMTLEDMMKTAK
mmetsp:Transcript_61031/g.90523  ORF Transcript_61031/g.90523 Transcript_61031/m.90523 type:complete len:163 (+) Transcript_61031:339-827(+)